VPRAIAIQQLLFCIGPVTLLELVKDRFSGDSFYSLFLQDNFPIGSCYCNAPPELRRVKTILNYGLPHKLGDEFIFDVMEDIFGRDGIKDIINKMFISRSCLKIMLNAGMEIGNHTHTHPFLTHLSKAEIKEEVITADSFLKSIGCTPVTLCYPFGGKLTPQVIDVIKDCGYLGGCNFQYSDDVNFGKENDYNLLRIPG